MICVDSNIWIYYLSSTAPEHKTVAESVRKALLKEDILMNPAIILEVAHYFRKLPKERLLKIVNYGSVASFGYPIRSLSCYAEKK